MERVRQLPCALQELARWYQPGGWWQCDGPIEAHHAGRRSVGTKCHDYETHAFCSRHHVYWHSHSGPFKGWSRSNRREWADQQIAATQAKLGYTKESR